MGRQRDTFGHVTFRTKPEFHRELLGIARRLGLDFSGLLNAMLAEAKPAFRVRADEVSTRNRSAKWGVPDDDVPLVVLAIETGYEVSERPRRIKAMREAVGLFRTVGDKEMQAILLAAEREIEEGHMEGILDLEELKQSNR